MCQDCWGFNSNWLKIHVSCCRYRWWIWNFDILTMFDACMHIYMHDFHIYVSMYIMYIYIYIHYHFKFPPPSFVPLAHAAESPCLSCLSARTRTVLRRRRSNASICRYRSRRRRSGLHLKVLGLLTCVDWNFSNELSWVEMYDDVAGLN